MENKKAFCVDSLLVGLIAITLAIFLTWLGFGFYYLYNQIITGLECHWDKILEPIVAAGSSIAIGASFVLFAVFNSKNLIAAIKPLNKLKPENQLKNFFLAGSIWIFSVFLIGEISGILSILVKYASGMKVCDPSKIWGAIAKYSLFIFLIFIILWLVLYFLFKKIKSEIQKRID